MPNRTSVFHFTFAGKNSLSYTDPVGYEPYLPGVMPLLEKHNVEILVADYEAKGLEGEVRGVNVVLRFESEEAALAW